MEEKILVEVNKNIQEPYTETARFDIKSMIYVVRNQQVMIDSDLAMLYQIIILNNTLKRSLSVQPRSRSA